VPLFSFSPQLNVMDCGPTCLYMVNKYYGREINIEKLRALAQIEKEGVSLLGISEAAEKIGYRTQAFQLTSAELQHVHMPCILHWQQNHFVVLVKWSKSVFRKSDKIKIADPGKGIFTLTKTDFEKAWISSKTDIEQTGLALTLEPTPAFYTDIYDADYTGEKSNRFASVIKYLHPYKKLLLQLVLGLLLGSFLQLIFPFLTQSIVDVGVNTGNLQFVYIILFAQLALFAGRLSVDFIRSWILYHISSRINISILTDFLIKLMKLPVSYFDSRKTGDVMQRMADHQRIQSFLTGTSLNYFFSI
jgi:ATP-binding cassette subfamily B protein